MIGQPSFTMRENLSLDIGEAIADSAIDQNRVASAHDERAGEVQPDAILLIGRMLALPQLARHHPKHTSTVVPPQPVGEKRDGKRTDRDFVRRLHRLKSFRTAASVTSGQATSSHSPSSSAEAELYLRAAKSC